MSTTDGYIYKNPIKIDIFKQPNIYMLSNPNYENTKSNTTEFMTRNKLKIDSTKHKIVLKYYKIIPISILQFQIHNHIF